MVEETGPGRTDDLDELRRRIEAIESGTQRDEPGPNHDGRATSRTDRRGSSSLRRSALQRKTPLRRSRKVD
jgi:hypothetical protein